MERHANNNMMLTKTLIKTFVWGVKTDEFNDYKDS